MKPKCLKCGAEIGTRIVFGYPGEKMMKQSERDEIVSGGCCN